VSEVDFRPRISELADLLEEVALPALVKRRNPFWISTPDGDQGQDWCGSCGKAKARHLRRHDRKRRGDYLLDGGWRTEEERMSCCAGCGVDLNVSLLKYGAYSELDQFRNYGVRPGNSYEAMCLYETLRYFEWGEEQTELAEEAAATAEAFLWSAT